MYSTFSSNKIIRVNYYLKLTKKFNFMTWVPAGYWSGLAYPSCYKIGNQLHDKFNSTVLQTYQKLYSK